MKSLLIFLVISLGAVSCLNSNSKKETEIITFSIEKLPKISDVALSELGLSDIVYIPLETTSNGLIQREFALSLSDKLLIRENFFIIKQFNKILKFNIDGTFVSRIGASGRGPNEYQTCHDIEVDDNGNIYIIDGWKKKLFIFSEQGDFIKTVNFPLDRSISFIYDDGKFLCYSQNNLGNVENSYNLVDTSGKIIRTFPNIYPFQKHNNSAYGITSENIFYQFNDRIFKKEVYSDTIYSFENTCFKPHMVIKAGNKLITPKARTEFDGLYLAKNYISPQNLFEFGDYIYYEFQYKFDFSNTEVYSLIGSKKTRIQFLIDPVKGLINDFDGGPNIRPLTIKDDNTIAGLVEANQLKAHVTTKAFKNSTPKYPEKKKALENLANILKETDNPVLMLVKLNSIK
jgi:hypothetical protein